MFSTIVVGTDGSETAGAAVDLAIGLADHLGSELHLVTAYKPAGSVVTMPLAGATVAADDAVLTAMTRQASEKLLSELAGGLEHLRVHTHVVPGAAAGTVVKLAEEVGADLIVVGSKGMQGSHRWLGSVPNSIAHSAPCHVLIAKTA